MPAGPSKVVWPWRGHDNAGNERRGRAPRATTRDLTSDRARGDTRPRGRGVKIQSTQVPFNSSVAYTYLCSPRGRSRGAHVRPSRLPPIECCGVREAENTRASTHHAQGSLTAQSLQVAGLRLTCRRALRPAARPASRQCRYPPMLAGALLVRSCWWLAQADRTAAGFVGAAELFIEHGSATVGRAWTAASSTSLDLPVLAAQGEFEVSVAPLLFHRLVRFSMQN